MRLLLMAILILLPVAGQPGLPTGAELTAKDTYRWKDKDGVVWLYHKSPFGWNKAKEADEKARVIEQAKGRPEVKVVALKQDEASFETASPFGLRKWTRKLSELTAEEKTAVEHWRLAETASK